MKLACEGCDWVGEAGTSDELYDAMMAHGADAHSAMFDGKTPDEIQQMRQRMEAHVRQMIIDQN